MSHPRSLWNEAACKDLPSEERKRGKETVVRAEQINEQWGKRSIHSLGIQQFLFVYVVFCKTEETTNR